MLTGTVTPTGHGMDHLHHASSGWLPQLVPGIGLALISVLYLAGTFRPHRGRRSRRRAIMFGAGVSLLAAAMLSPIHRLGEERFAWHMVQHQLLLVLAAPLLVAGRPLPVLLNGLPGWLRPAARGTASRNVLRFLSAPGTLVAAALHGVVVWVWHAPPFVSAAVTNATWHLVQHAMFVAAGVLFWASIERARVRERDTGAGIVSLLATGLHTGALGALLFFSTRPLYAEYVRVPYSAGVLEDQQLAGILMWVPGGFIYMAGALVLLAGMARTRAPARVRVAPAFRSSLPER